MAQVNLALKLGAVLALAIALWARVFDSAYALCAVAVRRTCL